MTISMSDNSEEKQDNNNNNMPNRIAAAIAALTYVIIGGWLAMAAIGIVSPPTGVWPLGIGAIASMVAAGRAVGVAIGRTQ